MAASAQPESREPAPIPSAPRPTLHLHQPAPASPPVAQRWAERFIQALIVYSIVTVALETMPELARWQHFFDISEMIVVAIFTTEYVVRWCYAQRKLSYPFHPLSIVDLVAVLPFYLSTGSDLRAVRSISLMRILKMSRHSRALRHLIDALTIVRRELAVFGFAASVIMLLAATGIYFAENATQPDKFSSIPACMWWAVVTLTTVGYGDLVPITPLGKFFASFVMVMGIGVVAIPTGLISSAMTELSRRNRDARPAAH